MVSHSALLGVGTASPWPGMGRSAHRACCRAGRKFRRCPCPLRCGWECPALPWGVAACVRLALSVCANLCFSGGVSSSGLGHGGPEAQACSGCVRISSCRLAARASCTPAPGGCSSQAGPFLAAFLLARGRRGSVPWGQWGGCSSGETLFFLDLSRLPCTPSLRFRMDRTASFFSLLLA